MFVVEGKLLTSQNHEGVERAAPSEQNPDDSRCLSRSLQSGSFPLSKYVRATNNTNNDSQSLRRVGTELGIPERLYRPELRWSREWLQT